MKMKFLRCAMVCMICAMLCAGAVFQYMTANQRSLSDAVLVMACLD